MASETKVTRISAKDTAPVTKVKKTATKKPSRTPRTPRNRFIKTLFAIGGYFKGAWVELRLVRWPTRKATWGLTLAVIIFSAFFVVLILLLDLLFKYLFELILS
ncbi:MAG: preprotein translocase subunit SecE [Candidatus Microsaccharimonas sp.]